MLDIDEVIHLAILIKKVVNELECIADRLGAGLAESNDVAIATSLSALQSAADAVGSAWSGSWLGYQALVYYRDFVPVPPGSRFSVEWGIGPQAIGRYTVGDWIEYSVSDVGTEINRRAGNPDVRNAVQLGQRLTQLFDSEQGAVSDLLGAAQQLDDSSVIQDLRRAINELKVHSADEFVDAQRPRGPVISRDMAALQGKQAAPPHIQMLAQVAALMSPQSEVAELKRLTDRACSHLRRLLEMEVAKEGGTKIFIGHGHSPVWRELSHFLSNRLKLECDEFNRVSAAGTPTTERLGEMLNEAVFAFLVLTGEDEQADKTLHARMNVIHEAGLFQGRLGFKKAIVLLEDGCDTFSNIDGLGHIRFSRGQIGHAFEEIRKVLEREGIITA